MKRKVTIMMPAYNEAANLEAVHKALDDFAASMAAQDKDLDWEFLFVNDGSRDNTLEVLQMLRHKDPRVNYVNLTRNFGKENALLAGFDYATGDCVVVMDADLQHPVDVVQAMIERWEEGFEDVYGRRLTRGKEPWLRRALTRLYYKLLQKSTRIEILPNVGDFRLLDRRCVNALKQLRETQRYTKGLYCWIGFRKTDVPYMTRDRQGGKSSFTTGRLVNLAVEGITGFTTAPLRFATIMGFIVSIAAFAYLLFVLFKTIICGEDVQGFPTLLCVMLFLGGCQLISLGFIGEYIGRLFMESKGRPPYIAERYNEEKTGK